MEFSDTRRLANISCQLRCSPRFLLSASSSHFCMHILHVSSQHHSPSGCLSVHRSSSKKWSSSMGDLPSRQCSNFLASSRIFSRPLSEYGSSMIHSSAMPEQTAKTLSIRAKGDGQVGCSKVTPDYMSGGNIFSMASISVRSGFSESQSKFQPSHGPMSFGNMMRSFRK